MSENQRVLWAGRFRRIPSDEVLSFTSSLTVDRRIAWYDVIGSIAHADMLAATGIITASDGETISKGLRMLLASVQAGKVDFDPDLEDVHTNVEFMLTKLVGEAGGRLHTARSRNDQVATDFRMFLRDSVLDVSISLLDLERVLVDLAKQNDDTLMPGFTHMQHAQPVTLAHHLLAHLQRLHRDATRLWDAYQRMNWCPLGSAALAGTTFPIDRNMTASALGFYGPCANSMDAVSDRDFCAEFNFDAALAMDHLSSISEEIVMWSTPEFGFVEVSDAYSTGSSIMPQKKNPDIAELIRGRTSVVSGNLASMLNLLKGLPLTYNRDLQEDKGLAISAADILETSLRMMAPMLSTLRVDRDRMREAAMQGYLNATELADYLVAKGVPFRTAHEITGRIVRYAIDAKKRLEDLSLSELRRFSDLIDPEVLMVLPVRSCVERRTSFGGTSAAAVKDQIRDAEADLQKHRDKIEGERRRLEKLFGELTA
jgi:argininosuccinate lyase